MSWFEEMPPNVNYLTYGAASSCQHQGAMTSPYLCRQRPAREVIEQQIAAHEAELSQTRDDAARRRIEGALARLRRELARFTASG